MKERSGKLKAQTVRLSEINEQDIARMFDVFSRYYENTSFEQFQLDLKTKEAIFLLRDSLSQEIMGFSTILGLKTSVNNKMIKGLFSGDTIIEKEYWGQGALGVAFLKYLFLQKIKNPFRPLYWFLISKGYKTYLLMANNFQEHYPRFEKQTPSDKQEIIDTFASKLYEQYYSSEKGVISFQNKGHQKDHLKCEITPISRDMMLKNPRIHFFAEKNPGWEQGDELACIAKMTFTMPLYYQLKIWKKQFSRLTSGLELRPRYYLSFVSGKLARKVRQ